jgi:hypothetical protein
MSMSYLEWNEDHISVYSNKNGEIIKQEIYVDKFRTI